MNTIKIGRTLMWLLIAAIFSASIAQGQTPNKTPRKAPEPNWITTHILPAEKPVKKSSLVGGFHYLLIDIQTNLKTQQDYHHYAIRMITAEGVQNLSDIDIDYDPSYQSLVIHKVRLHRDGRIIDNLTSHEIKTFQRESGMDYHLYDGTQTAVINQENVHIGDILEYSYTITGFNPIHGDDFFDTYYQKISFPFQDYYRHLVAPKDIPVHFLSLNDASVPDKKVIGSTVYYFQEFHDVTAHLFQDHSPFWYNPLPQIQVSTFEHWQQMVGWALPNYHIPTADLESLRKETAFITSANILDDQILQAIRFVQEDVRYLGLESGLGAYRPNPPLKVYQRRFGDCKDKSLLLSAMLHNLGVAAYPVLVNTNLESTIEKEIPSPLAFNHCIVTFTHKGRDYFIDPTNTAEGGDLEHRDTLYYGKGLIIADGVKDLTDLPTPVPFKLDVQYIFTLEDIGSSARMDVITTYQGPNANNKRYQLQNTSLDEISQSSLNYYSEAYPSISLHQPISVSDDRRELDNILVISESYFIEEFWTTSESDTMIIYVELLPMELISVVDIPASPDRTAPYTTGRPLDMTLNLELNMPSDWPVDIDKVVIEGDAYHYSSDISSDGPQIRLKYTYKRLKQHISAENTRQHIADHDRIWDDMVFFLSYDYSQVDAQFSWPALGVAFLVFLGCLFLALRLHRSYDPVPATTQSRPLSFGGWIILPMLGLTISPILVLTTLFYDTIFFDHQNWLQILGSGSNQIMPGYGALVVFEFLGNIIFLSLSLLVLVQFYKKRSSLPRVFVFTQVFIVSFLALDLVAVLLYSGPEVESVNLVDMAQELFRSSISIIIWGNYFLKSKRAKQTFIVRADGSIPEPEQNPEISETIKPANTHKWPASLVFCAIVQGLAFVGAIIYFITKFTGDIACPHEPGSPGAWGFWLGNLITISFMVGTPFIGLMAILRRRSWARKYNLILLSLFMAFLTIAVGLSLDHENSEEISAGFLGLLIFTVPLLILTVVLARSQAAKIFPQEIATGSAAHNQCISQVMAVFEDLKSQFPHLEMTITGKTPEKTVSLVIAKQPGVPRLLFMDLQKGDTLNLSIGPIWLVWQPCNNASVLADFSTTVSRLLNGQDRLVEYLDNNQVAVAEIQRPEIDVSPGDPIGSGQPGDQPDPVVQEDQKQNNGDVENDGIKQPTKWRKHRKWARQKMTSTLGMKEVLVVFGSSHSRP